MQHQISVERADGRHDARDPIDGKTTLITLAQIQLEIESLTGVQVDIATPMALHERYRRQVLNEAVPYRFAPRHPGDIAQCWADPTLAGQLLGWKATA